MKKIILYQLLVRLFGNKNKNTKLFGSIHENGCGKFNDINVNALNSLKHLGITHLWFTGIIAHAKTTDYRVCGLPQSHAEIVKGRAGSPYAITDYFDVDPDLAEEINMRMDEFAHLIERTHHAGLKVVIDFVPNHVAREYHGKCSPPGINILGKDDITSQGFCPQNNFFYLCDRQFVVPEDAIPADMKPLPGELWEGYTEFPAKATGNDCFVANPAKEDWYDTIKLNYGIDYLADHKYCFDPVPSTWDRMREIILFWAEKGVDGFRCDMAGMVPPEFWGWLIPVVKRSYPSLLFIAEIYEPQHYRRYIAQGQFDYLYDKVGLYETLREVIQSTRPAADISLSWQNLDGLDDHMLRFLENHDEQRIASKHFGGNPLKAVPAMVAAATLNNGPLMIYFGQEVGEPALGRSGYSGDDGRTTLFDYYHVPEHQKWMNEGSFDGGLLEPWQHKLRQFYRKLFELCHEHEPFYQGELYDLMWVNQELIDQKCLYAYLRFTADECLLIVLNFSNKDQNDIRVHIPQHAFDIIQKSSESILEINRKSRFTAHELLWGYDQVVFTVAQAIDDGIPLSLNPHSALIYSF